MYYVRNRNFPAVREELRKSMMRALPVRTERWQGIDVSKDPSATTYEIRNVVFECDLNGVEDLEYWRQQIAPNLPWADDHFLERVGGEPLNPGVQWANWPWASSADRFRDKDAIFNHTYMERFWPKYARKTAGGMLVDDVHPSVPAHRGIAYEYGDLMSLVNLLANEPGTRQAWIPLFFPEDTGFADGGRKPCTLGYQILVRDNEAHMWYPLRSCDFVRHWADDCYLAVRLLLWIVDRCRLINPEKWGNIKAGTYSMHMTSLHIFENDRRAL